VWINPKGSRDGLLAAAFLPWPRDEGVILLPAAADRAKGLFEQPPAVFWSALERITPLADSLREQVEFPRDFRRVARPFGHVGSYVANGAALIGDAAHPMTPAGGQGANASIWDAFALAEAADAALREGDVSSERLLPYERTRHPVNDKSVSFSRMAGRVFRVRHLLPPAIAPLIARTINRLGWPKQKVIRSFGRAFVGPPKM
jgi:2-polyprenyl-6-methoxyphenol hydroxylase-like FAD-dependent oxidoreductase